MGVECEGREVLFTSHSHFFLRCWRWRRWNSGVIFAPQKSSDADEISIRTISLGRLPRSMSRVRTPSPAPFFLFKDLGSVSDLKWVPLTTKLTTNPLKSGLFVAFQRRLVCL